MQTNNSQQRDTAVGRSADLGWAVQLRKINKRFGVVHANRDVDLDVKCGTIHGIVGENGAGKSTLMEILYGFYEADSGEICIKGDMVKITDSRHALALGIGMVHQHFMLVHNFTVLENVLLGSEDSALLGPSKRRARAELERIEREYNLVVDPNAKIEDLSVGQQQRVEILKALYRGAETLILDEPTGVLTPKEADDLFELLRTLRDQGKTVILITHKLREVMAITDNVSVMRQGSMVQTLPTKDTNPEHLAELMVGRRVLLRVDKSPASPGETVLEIKNVLVTDDDGVDRVKSVNLNLRAGEIVGIAGISGNGQSELMEAIAGMRKLDGGEILLRGKSLKMSGDAAAGEVRAEGIAHVPEDRLRMGLIASLLEWENAILGYHRLPEYGSSFFLDVDAAKKVAREQIEMFDVRPPDINLKSALFSGGNQQKIVLAREMMRDPDVLIIGQPTRGVDIGAIEFIHKEIIRMRDAGKAILLVSVELDEIRALSDRIAVMFDGAIMGEVDPETATESALGMMMAGVVVDQLPGTIQNVKTGVPA